MKTKRNGVYMKAKKGAAFLQLLFVCAHEREGRLSCPPPHPLTCCKLDVFSP